MHKLFLEDEEMTFVVIHADGETYGYCHTSLGAVRMDVSELRDTYRQARKAGFRRQDETPSGRKIARQIDTTD